MSKQTVGEAWRWASSFLQQYQVEDSNFEAELLLRFALGWDRTRFFTHLDESLDPSVYHRYQKWLHRRREGVPLQYLMGEQEFYGRLFQVNESVLIPRPETEILVETVLRETKEWSDQNRQVVDVGTGSGAVAVTLAAERPSWGITAVDCSPQALQVAKGNAGNHHVEERIDWYQGSWLSPLQERDIKVDILVSNPPYIPTAVIPGLEVQVRDHEPILALDGGSDGLDPYRKILDMAPGVLKYPGLIVFEVGDEQSEAVSLWINEIWPKATVSVFPDLAGRNRVVSAWVNRY